MEAISHQKGSETTQVATTTGTYRKTAEKLLPHFDQDETKKTLLDYGAGMGKGTDAMKQVLGDKHHVISYEPFAKGWVPDHTSSDTIPTNNDAVVSHNVLNVLEPNLRSQVTHDILSKVKPGGKVVIGARGYKGDVATAKNVTPSDSEPNAVWVHKKVGAVYQRGFDGDELLNHMKSHDPDNNFEFKKVSGLAKNTVIGTRKK